MHQVGNGKPRWLNWLRAKIGGFFWLPCPVCKRKFGGHEWQAEAGYWIMDVPDEPWRGHGVCSAECKRQWEHERIP